MPHKDLVRLKHMLDSANAAVFFVKERQRKDLDTDRQLLSALTRELEILGEAANHISQSVQSEISQIPWKQIISMRNRLIHAYFDVSEASAGLKIQRLPEISGGTSQDHKYGDLEYL